MKFNFFLILYLLILLIKFGESDDDDVDQGLEDLCQQAKPTSASSCSEAFNETIKKEYSCCYTEIKEKGKDEEKGCHALTKAQVKDLDTFKKELKEEEGFEDLEIDCDSSAFLKIGLLSLFATLLI